MTCRRSIHSLDLSLYLCQLCDPVLTILEENDLVKQYVEPLKEVTVGGELKMLCVVGIDLEGR